MSEHSSLLICFQLKGKNVERCKLLIGLVIKAAVEGGCCILEYACATLECENPKLKILEYQYPEILFKFWHSKIMDSGFDAILWCDHQN